MENLLPRHKSDRSFITDICVDRIGHIFLKALNMTILTSSACAYIIKSTNKEIPAFVGTAAGALVSWFELLMRAGNAKTAVLSAIASGTASGAVAGTSVALTKGGAASGALVGGLSGGGVGSMMAFGIAISNGQFAYNTLGLLTVGTSTDEFGATFDCWKPVVHDMSEERSRGMLLKDLILHPNVANVSIRSYENLPQIILKNIWNEEFELYFVVLKDTGDVSLHAFPLCN